MKRPPLSKERWQQIEELFQAAKELAPDEQASFLDDRCVGDSELRREVESWLAADVGSDSFMMKPVAAEAAAVGENGSASLVGQRIGPYELFRKLGQGGMGSVYLAGRVDKEYHKRVTIKLINPGLDSEGILRRFRNERQILASLDHPNVARLHDGGTAENGLPYLVMEYIEGEPIDEYCDRQELDIDKRLELFADVCSAVSVVHQNTVVHRDIKPGNILVTADGVPKLLDFGIAKLLNPELSGQPVHLTGADRMRLMTRAYASPEQIRGEPITTASDVYSLGVLLYELLTGHPPYRLEDSRPAEIERVVCETEPVKPSTVVRRPLERPDEEPQPPEKLSRRRGSRPEKLSRRLKGDLDNIILKAMAKSPKRRYQSVEKLADDLKCYRLGLPVSAQASSWAYRSGKFVRRNKLGVAFVVLLAVFAVTMTVLSFRLKRQVKIAANQTVRAEQVSGFLVDLFKISDPSESKGETVTAREILDKGKEAIDQELSGEPEVRATLMQTMGSAYMGLGRYDVAKELIEEGLKIRLDIFGHDAPQVAESLHAMAEALFTQGDYEASEDRFREALANRRRRLAAQPLDVAASLNGLALALRAQDEHEEAEERAREALAILRRFPDKPELAESLNALGSVFYSRGDWKEAEPLFREALEALRRIRGEVHPDVAVGLNNLAAVLARQAKYQEAEGMHREALQVRRRLFGNEHPEVANTLNNLAVTVQEQGRFEEAEELLRETLAMRRRQLGDQHPLVAKTMQNLAAAPLTSKGEYEVAEDLLREALALSRLAWGEEHQEVARILFNISGVLYAKGDFRSAEMVCRNALGMFRRVYSDDHPNAANGLDILGRILQAQGDFAAAEAAYREGLDVLRRLQLEGHPWMARGLNDLASLLVETKDFRAAEPLAREALRIYRQAYSAGHVRIRLAENTLGACLSGLGHYTEAERLLLDSYPVLKDRTSSRSQETQIALRRLVTHYEAWGKPDLAEQYRLFQR